MVISFSDTAEKFGGIQHFCLMGKNWLLDVLRWPIHKSSEKRMFDQTTMHDCVTSNLNSEQLVLGLRENPKLSYSLVMKQKNLGAFNIFV